jgi:hypothetical protein
MREIDSHATILVERAEYSGTNRDLGNVTGMIGAVFRLLNPGATRTKSDFMVKTRVPQ